MRGAMCVNRLELTRRLNVHSVRELANVGREDLLPLLGSTQAQNGTINTERADGRRANKPVVDTRHGHEHSGYPSYRGEKRRHDQPAKVVSTVVCREPPVSPVARVLYRSVKSQALVLTKLRKGLMADH